MFSIISSTIDAPQLSRAEYQIYKCTTGPSNCSKPHLNGCNAVEKEMLFAICSVPRYKLIYV